jgi:hypothetical protein
VQAAACGSPHTPCVCQVTAGRWLLQSGTPAATGRCPLLTSATQIAVAISRVAGIGAASTASSCSARTTLSKQEGLAHKVGVASLPCCARTATSSTHHHCVPGSTGHRDVVAIDQTATATTCRARPRCKRRQVNQQECHASDAGSTAHPASTAACGAAAGVYCKR